MDYEKKYNEALERAKELLLGNEHSNTIRSYFEHIFHELAESEDERIRKAIVLGIKRCADAGSIFGTVINNEGVNYHDVLEWLEKQKELMPPVNVDPCDASCDAYYQRGLNNGYELGLEAGRKEQKPAWSEEDEKNLELVTDCVYEFYPDPVMKYKLKDWLTQRFKFIHPSKK